jgi:putative endonuclease
LFYTYIISCKDGSLYTGYTTDIKRRLGEHRNGINSKYTRARGFSDLEALFGSDSKSKAMKLEYGIKKLSRNKKLILIKNPDKLSDYFEDFAEYEVCEFTEKFAVGEE